MTWEDGYATPHFQQEEGVEGAWTDWEPTPSCDLYDEFWGLPSAAATARLHDLLVEPWVGAATPCPTYPPPPTRAAGSACWRAVPTDPPSSETALHEWEEAGATLALLMVQRILELPLQGWVLKGSLVERDHDARQMVWRIDSPERSVSTSPAGAVEDAERALGAMGDVQQVLATLEASLLSGTVCPETLRLVAAMGLVDANDFVFPLAQTAPFPKLLDAMRAEDASAWRASILGVSLVAEPSQEWRRQGPRL